ncbi:unnamed protein product [Durusdinium trenchii]|uniref:Pseudouridine synthase RsuA/RluA-like domain-containing protein n=1 Tax=Durusdinium trenchii TaxID=1381693 RepID=A0ABP0JVB2_9DINO
MSSSFRVAMQQVGVHGRFLHAAFDAALKKLNEFDIRGLANLAWAVAVSRSNCAHQKTALLTQLASAAQVALRHQLRSVSNELEVRSLIFSLLSLAWALRFQSSLGRDVEGDLYAGLRHLARVLESSRCRWPRPDRPLQMASLPKELNEPIVILNCRGMVVALKPPGWEVDTSAKGQSEALSLSMFLQSQLPPEENNLLYDFNYGFGFVHRLDVASSGLILAARTFDGLICLQWQKALCAIDREYIVVCTGLGETLRMVTIRAEVAARGLHKYSRTLTQDNGLPAETRLRTVAQLNTASGGLLGGASLVVIQIYTGRRHQIRAHTRFIGHPTACDAWYTPNAVRLYLEDLLQPMPLRAWVRTPRWVGELIPPPKDMVGEVYDPGLAAVQ